MYERLKSLIAEAILNSNVRGCNGRWWAIPFVLLFCQVNALSAVTSYPTAFGPSSVVSAPFVNATPAVSHVAVATIGSATSQLTIYLNDGNGNFHQGDQYTIEGATGVIAATATFATPGTYDIVVLTNSSQLYFFQGNGDGTFKAPTKPSVQPLTSPIGIALGNFSRSNINSPEIAIAFSTASFVEIFHYDGSIPGLAFVDSFPTNGLATGIAAGNIDKNMTMPAGLDSIVLTYGASDNIQVYHNKTSLPGPMSFATSASDVYAVGTFPVGVIVADINGDGFPAIAVANAMSSNVSVLLNTKVASPMPGAGTFNPSVNYAVKCGPFALTLLPDGVFTAGANKNSIAVACQAQSVVSLLLYDGVGTGTFSAGPDQCAGSGPVSITANNKFISGSTVDSIAVANITGNTFSFIKPVNMVVNCSPLASSAQGAIDSLFSPKPEFQKMLCRNILCSQKLFDKRNSQLQKIQG